jgi:probable F420-dependent oxidoreductase
MEQLRDTWRRADAAGADSIWVWDHFYPLYGEELGPHFEGWTLLAAAAADTSHAKLGVLVSCNTYRNPDLLVDMARTVDHISGGRAYLGLGAGWFERDYAEYGYAFGTPRSRLDNLAASIDRIAARKAKLNPPPIGELPLMIGGWAPKILGRLIARHADAWNAFGSPQEWGAKNAKLTELCHEVGRDPAAIERTVLLTDDSQVDQIDEYAAAGAAHVILTLGTPFDLVPMKRALAAKG